MTRIKKNHGLWAAALALSCLSSYSALAGPLDEARARIHVQAIAAGELDTIMRDYADDAYLEWVGGPLDGRYHSKDAIRAVWQKFIDANAGKPRKAQFSPQEDYANAKGSTVEAQAQYGGTTPVKVWHAQTYRDGSLVTEIWQTVPAGPLEK